MSTPSAPIRIIITGAAGRMGKRLCALALDDAAFTLVGAVERVGAPSIGSPAAVAAASPAPNIAAASAFPPDFKAQIVVDFSSDEGAKSALELAQRLRAALLIGTTALSESTLALLRTASAQTPVLVAPNTSRGVSAVAAIIERAAQLLGPGFECSMVEAHHAAKKDAPSGTALRLAAAARAGGARLDDAQVHSIRGGDVIGEHTIRFAAQGEYIEITHRATTRDLFALGALQAAKWLAQQRPGWWTMNDVLGLPAR